MASKVPHEKTIEEMNLAELTNYWTGHAVLEIGQGHSLRDAISLMLQCTMGISYDRGLKDGKSGKRGGA